MAATTHPLGTGHLQMLARFVERTVNDGAVADDVRRAVDVITSAAAPHRAARLAVRPGEPVPLVERLLVWGLHRTTDEALAHAMQLLTGAPCHPRTQPRDKTAATALPPAAA